MRARRDGVPPGFVTMPPSLFQTTSFSSITVLVAFEARMTPARLWLMAEARMTLRAAGPAASLPPTMTAGASFSKRKRPELWRQAAFFGNIRIFRPTLGDDNFALLEGPPLEKYVQFHTGGSGYNPKAPSFMRPARYKADVSPQFILDGEKPEPGKNPRQEFARILTSHPQFAKATVNIDDPTRAGCIRWPDRCIGAGRCPRRRICRRIRRPNGCIGLSWCTG